MSLNLANNITIRSWDTIPMPDTVLARVNKLACNEPNQFILTERRDRPIEDAEITGLDRDTDDINENQAPQYPPHKLQAIEDTEEEPVIIDPKIDLDINHETPTEQV